MSDATSEMDQPESPIDRARELVIPALRKAVDQLEPRMRLIAGYQLGWWDGTGQPTPDSGGKALRQALAIVSAEAAGGQGDEGIPGAIAVELVHNFSLLHDDIMDRDVERRGRPTGWMVFGEGQAILGGTAMLTLAIQVLHDAGPGGMRALPCLTASVQGLIDGQSDDLYFEASPEVDLAACLRMEAGKTAALIACSASIGALTVGAPPSVVDGLAAFGYELGIAFQLVDDVLGIVGDPKVTGKSSSSDVRARKRSAPVVAALSSGAPEAVELAALMSGDEPLTEAEVLRAKDAIVSAGGIEWATREADARLSRGLAHLHKLPLTASAANDFVALADKLVRRSK
jgi:geranylgeranyl diphosphate synthase type I